MGDSDMTEGGAAATGSSARGRRPSQNLLFLKNFLRYPTKVGWLLPSSSFLVNQVLRRIDWDRARVIVEYGPGTGCFTRKVLERMRPDARLVALEINPEFFEFLRRSLEDPRLHLVRTSAADIDLVLGQLGIEHADYVISGIPFTTLTDSLRDLIVRKTYDVLKPSGGFLVYQLSGVVAPYLERVFGNVTRDFELLNILPARLFCCAR